MMYPIDNYILALESIGNDCEKQFADYQMARIMGGPAMEAIDIKNAARTAWEKIKGFFRKILGWIVGIPAKIHGGVNKLLGILSKTGNEGTADPNKFQEAMSKLQEALNNCGKLNNLVKTCEDAMNELQQKPDSDPTWISSKIAEIKQKRAAAKGASTNASESFAAITSAMEADAAAPAAAKKKVNFGGLKNLLSRIGSQFDNLGKRAAKGTENANAAVNKAANEEPGENTTKKQGLLSTIGAALADVGSTIARKWGEFTSMVSSFFHRDKSATVEDYNGPNPAMHTSATVAQSAKQTGGQLNKMKKISDNTKARQSNIDEMHKSAERQKKFKF